MTPPEAQTLPERRHERDYTAQGFRQHMIREHGAQVGSVRLATFISHRRKHAAGKMPVPHTHCEVRTT